MHHGEPTFQPKNRTLQWVERRLPIFGLMHSSFVSYPPPRNLNYWWTFGGILSFMLGVQIVTGVVLVMHFTPTADGGRQIISYISHFNFNWMTNYIYADDVAPVFPKGTIIHVSAFYDNTKANKNNPDSDQWVGYGDRTVDEMAHAWMNVTYLNDQEYQAIVAERKAKTTNSTQDQQQ